jgi:hypothetical protein
LVVAALALAACATAGEAAAPEGTTFRGVRRIALVRVVEDRPGRVDALDGLDQSLRARGYETRVVELHERHNPPELAGVERLFGKLERRAATPRSERLGVRGVADAGRDAGAAVASLGVDAVATYHRLETRRWARRTAEPAVPGAPLQLASPGPGPAGALALVDRAGHVATYPWGDAGPFDDPATPVNSAEAIELLVRALTGEAPPGEAQLPELEDPP